MERISNEEKAKEISQQGWGCGKQQQITAYEAAIEAMEWKDEQFLQWLKESLAKETSTMFTSESQGVINFEPVIKAFEKFIKQ